MLQAPPFNVRNSDDNVHFEDW